MSVATQDGVQVPLFRTSAQLLWGSTFRYFAFCAAWSSCRVCYALLRGRGRSASQAAKHDWKVWSACYGMEVGVSLLICPMRYLTGKQLHRLIFDMMYEEGSFHLKSIDGFDPYTFLPYAFHALAADDESNWAFFTWHLPATALTLTKLAWRVWRLGSRNTKTKRCLGVVALQYFLRTLMCSFCATLPTSEQELILVLILMSAEKWSDAYLMRNTWPFNTVCDGALSQ